MAGIDHAQLPAGGGAGSADHESCRGDAGSQPKQTSVSVESVTANPATRPASRSLTAPDLAEGRIVAFPAHVDASTVTTLPETLSPGDLLATSNTDAIFVAGGPLTHLDHLPGKRGSEKRSRRSCRPGSLATLASSMDRMRQLWSTFRGNASGEAGIPKGMVSTGDLPALFILKTMLDMKVIEAGWWRDVTLRIDAGEGSTLEIAGGSSGQTCAGSELDQGIGTTSPDAKVFTRACESDSPVRCRASRSAGLDVGARPPGSDSRPDNDYAAARPGCRADLLLG